jgi:hypothetical protein
MIEAEEDDGEGGEDRGKATTDGMDSLVGAHLKRPLEDVVLGDGDGGVAARNERSLYTVRIVL